MALESIYKELVKSTTKHDSTMRICAPSFFFRILGTFFFFPMTLLATKETHILSFTLFIPSLDFPCLVLPFFLTLNYLMSTFMIFENPFNHLKFSHQLWQVQHLIHRMVRLDYHKESNKVSKIMMILVSPSILTSKIFTS